MTSSARGTGPAKRLVLLGATGSIGKSCARVILDNPGRFSVEAVVGGRDGAALARTAIELGAKFAAISDPAGYADLKAGLSGRSVETACGPQAMEAAARWPADLVVSAIVGAVGLGPTYAAIESGRTIALANKETLVCAGAPVMRGVTRHGATLLPLDSEHNAIFQALGGRDTAEISVMTITASGGPFREWGAERIAKATRAEALAHPKWNMGPKISVDSASLMNKGLELIEAHHLFAIPAEKLAVVVHPQSIVHGLIAFADGSTLAGLANPDMRTAVAHCLAYPERVPSGVEAPDLISLSKLTFEPVDFVRFPALALAREALAEGAGAPTALNAANEIAVAAFLDGKIAFGALAGVVGRTLEAMRAAGEIDTPADIDAALAIHHVARERAASLLA